MSKKNARFLFQHLDKAIDSFAPNAHTESEIIEAVRLLVQRRGKRKLCDACQEEGSGNHRASRVLLEVRFDVETGEFSRDVGCELSLCSHHAMQAEKNIAPDKFIPCDACGCEAIHE